MDHYAFAALAHVRILLIPVGSIEPPVFDKWAAEIRQFDSIALGDVPADNRDDRARFMPNPLASGSLHVDFPTHPPPSSHELLSLFRPSHFPLGVIGVACCSGTDSLSSIQARFNASLTQMLPSNSMFPLARNCFVFEEDDGNTNLNLGDHLPGLVVIPSMMGNKKLYIGTLLADLCSQILGEFSALVQTLESPVGNEYLNSTLFPILPPTSDIPEALDKMNGLDNRHPIPHYNSQPELATSTHRKGFPPTLKRNYSLGPPGAAVSVNLNRHSSLAAPANSKKRHSGIGAASSHGRLFKVLGDLFLLAGRTEDASVWYTEAIALFRSPQDGIWHASALEGLVTVAVLDAWSAGHGLNSSFSQGREPITDLADKLAQAVALYSKPSLSDGDSHLPLLVHLHTCAVLRHTALLFAVWSAKGWGPLAFTTMLQPGSSPYLPPTLSHDHSTSDINLERLSSLSGISRSQIAVVLAQAHGPWLLHLGPQEKVATLQAIASIYGCLGYRRKEAYILRETLGCIMDLVACGRQELGGKGSSNSRADSVGLGIEGVEMGGVSPSNERGAVGIRENESSDGNESVLRVVKYICKVHGIDLQAVKLNKNNEQRTLESGIDSAREQGEDDSDNNYEPFGWPEIQVGILHELLAVTEALPNYPAVAQFALSALKSLHPVLSEKDQLELHATAAHALETTKRRGDQRWVEYWSGRPIVSIELSPMHRVRVPSEKPISVLETRPYEAAQVLSGVTDPFLYNPRKSMSGKGLMVVQGENVEFIMTFQNPYAFELDLLNLSLSVSGASFQSKPISVTIPPNSIRPVTISGKALEVGTLAIRGCLVQLPSGVLREFLLPLSTDEEEDRRSRRRSSLQCEEGRVKYSGLDAQPWVKSSRRISRPGASSSLTRVSRRFLECQVVPELPLLRIKRTSLTHGAVMLYNGEKSVVRLTLENVSSIPIDFISVTFDDSTMSPAHQALAEGNLSVFDAYETEYDLLRRPVFSWEGFKEMKPVEPGSQLVVTLTAFGKVGCTSGTIQVSYANVKRRQTSLQKPVDVFYTRQATYPVLVTVYHMLECHSMDIIPYHGTDVRGEPTKPSSWEIGELLSQIGDGVGWCLFSVDVRNTYGLPFEVTFSRVQEGAPEASVTSLVPPGSTTRIIIPIRKFLIPDSKLSNPIPTLSERQFVLNKSKLSSAEEKLQRELFWYREEVIQCVRGRWREGGGTRCGDLSLRQQRMTLPMLETLRIESARVKMSLHQSINVGESEVDHGESGYFPPAGEFLYLLTRITNLSPSEMILSMNISMEPRDHIIFEGVPSGIPIGRLQPNQSHDVVVAICFVAWGRFDIKAEISTLDTQDSRVGWGHLRAVVREDA
ncbi:hypothetical protein JAAARDRAFT_31778 [Jaapia argillacea MUCL 33604]|uniref:Uncharacterized protein n=1 Tax=Jaapia argillacea MUCL 33604 TaxID=933084 RepID=A0A067Q150_9AGAM|nr:hypothetical protein JAAARDRAFT_31778 [Jaapia argillacea MUCL 33604]